MSAQQIEAKNDLDVLRKRLVAALLAGQADVKEVRRHLQSQKPDGSWEDVDYADRSLAHWKPQAHLSRLLSMSRALKRQDSALTGDESLRAAIQRGLDYWLEHDPQSANWWYNTIGAPLALGELLLTGGELFTAGQVEAGCRMLARSQINMTGQNLLWLSRVNLYRAVLEGDVSLAGKAISAMSKEIAVNRNGEGIQPDMSFHQHGRCLYSLGYGRGFSADGSRLARLVHGTGLALEAEKVNLLVEHLLDGQRWMFRGSTGDFGAAGREISRPAWNNRALAEACDDLASMEVRRADELRAFATQLREQEGIALTQLSGNRCYNWSDMMIHHRAGWYASARGYSNRLMNTDSPCSNEATLSHYIADGCNILMKSGREYKGIFPVWDWRLVPGTTALQAPLKRLKDVRRQGSTEFVGGVSDGRYGVQAFDLQRPGLVAHKAWFFFDDLYVCLGAGIRQTEGETAVRTSINQCHLVGEVKTGGDDGEVRVLDRGTHELPEDVRWVHHDGVGYLPAEGSAVTVRLDDQQGSWRLISDPQSKAKVVLPVFSLWLDHAPKSGGATYQYIVVPEMATTVEAAQRAAKSVRVTANSSQIQAVELTGRALAMAVFYDPAGGQVELSWGERLAVDHDCLVIVHKTAEEVRLTVARPQHEKATVKVSVGQSEMTIETVDGQSVSQTE